MYTVYMYIYIYLYWIYSCVPHSNCHPGLYTVDCGQTMIGFVRIFSRNWFLLENSPYLKLSSNMLQVSLALSIQLYIYMHDSFMQKDCSICTGYFTIILVIQMLANMRIRHPHTHLSRARACVCVFGYPNRSCPSGPSASVEAWHGAVPGTTKPGRLVVPPISQICFSSWESDSILWEIGREWWSLFTSKSFCGVFISMLSNAY